MKTPFTLATALLVMLAFSHCGDNHGSASENSHQSADSKMTDSLSSSPSTGGSPGTSLETSTPTNDSGTATNPAATELGHDSAH